MNDDAPKPKQKPSERPHYVNNAEFSKAVVEYVKQHKKSQRSGEEAPRISEYIGSCLLKIAEGLSHKPNFIRYTYRDDMVMDAVENCLKAITNFDVNVGTRTGLPNAFAYFTQISYYAFLRRIAKEKKVQDIKLLYMEHAGIESFADWGSDDDFAVGEGIVERIRHKVEKVHDRDEKVKQFGKILKGKKPSSKKSAESTLEMFLAIA